MKPDWKDAPEWANWLAMYEDGTWFWFKDEPYESADCGLLGGCWDPIDWPGVMEKAGETPHDFCIWWQSLEKRPT